MASYTADSIIKECRDFVHLKESNYLYSSFVERLDELASTKNSGLTEKQRKAYTRQNSAYIKNIFSRLMNSLFPAFPSFAIPVRIITDYAIFQMAGLTTNIW